VGEGAAEHAVWTDKVPATVCGVRVNVGRHFPSSGFALVLRGRYNIEADERLLPGCVWEADPMMIYGAETEDTLNLGLTLV